MEFFQNCNFRIFLDARKLGRARFPVVMGLQNSGKFPGFNWLEITYFTDVLEFDDGQVKIPESIDLNIIAVLSEIVPNGGHLMVEYDSIYRFFEEVESQWNRPSIQREHQVVIDGFIYKKVGERG